MAFEDASKNAYSGIAYVVSYALTIVAALYFIGIFRGSRPPC